MLAICFSKIKHGLKIGLWVMLSLWLLPALAAASACATPEALQQAKALYVQAKAAQDPEQAVSLLRESISACKTFQNYTLLSYSLLQLQRYNEALDAAGGALQKAATERAKVRARWLLARAHWGQRNTAQAIAEFEAAYAAVKSGESPPDWLINDHIRFEDELYNDGPLSAETISDSLKSNRSTGAAPRISLRVPFDFNSAVLKPQGKAQVNQVVKVLAMGGSQSYRFRIIGHTDEQGAEDYNQHLSECRAKMVIDEMLSLQPALASRLCLEGLGERQPRAVNAKTDEQHAFNRRVELKLESNVGNQQCAVDSRGCGKFIKR